MTITKTNVEIKAVGFVQSHAEQTFFFYSFSLGKNIQAKVKN